MTAYPLTEDQVTAAANRLPHGGIAGYDDDGDLAGLVYFATETRTWYAADVAACRALAELELTSEDFGGDLGDPGRYRAAEVYARWCTLPEAQPVASGPTADDALEAAGWTRAGQDDDHEDPTP